MVKIYNLNLYITQQKRKRGNAYEKENYGYSMCVCTVF